MAFSPRRTPLKSPGRASSRGASRERERGLLSDRQSRAEDPREAIERLADACRQLSSTVQSHTIQLQSLNERVSAVCGWRHAAASDFAKLKLMQDDLQCLSSFQQELRPQLAKTGNQLKRIEVDLSLAHGVIEDTSHHVMTLRADLRALEQTFAAKCQDMERSFLSAGSLATPEMALTGQRHVFFSDEDSATDDAFSDWGPAPRPDLLGTPSGLAPSGSFAPTPLAPLQESEDVERVDFCEPTASKRYLALRRSEASGLASPG